MPPVRRSKKNDVQSSISLVTDLKLTVEFPVKAIGAGIGAYFFM